MHAVIIRPFDSGDVVIAAIHHDGDTGKIMYFMTLPAADANLHSVEDLPGVAPWHIHLETADKGGCAIRPSQRLNT